MKLRYLKPLLVLGLVLTSLCLTSQKVTAASDTLPDPGINNPRVHLATYIEGTYTQINVPTAEIIITYDGNVTSSKTVEIYDGVLCDLGAGSHDTFGYGGTSGVGYYNTLAECKSSNDWNLIYFTFCELKPDPDESTKDCSYQDSTSAEYLDWKGYSVPASRFTYDPATNTSSTQLTVSYEDPNTDDRNNGFKVRATGGYVGFSGTDSRVALQDRDYPSDADENTFKIRFGAPCTVSSSVTLRWYDADHVDAGGNPYDNPRFELWDRTDDVKVLDISSASALGGNKQEKSDTFTPEADHNYEWIWYNIDDNNGVQFYLPNGYYGTYYETHCVEDATEYDHVVKHRIASGSPVEVEPLDVVTVEASVCNIGDGIFYPENNDDGDDPMALRIIAPNNTDDASDRFTRMDDTYKTYWGDPGDPPPYDNITKDPDNDYDARWEIRHHDGVPEDGSGTASSCDGSDDDGDGSTGYGSGRGWVSVDYQVPADAAPGDEYCFNARVWPNAGISGPPSKDDNGAVTSGEESCFKVVNRPYFKVLGADLWAGAYFASQIGSDDLGNCDEAAVPDYGDLYDGNSLNDGHIFGNNLQANGSSGEYGVYGLGNTRIASRNTRTMDLGTGAADEPYKVIPLMFGNSINGSFLLGGTADYRDRGYFYSDGYTTGGPAGHEVEAKPRCIDDYYKAAEAQFTDEQTKEFSSNTLYLSSTEDEDYRLYKHTGSGPLVIYRHPTADDYINERRITIISSSETVIRQNIFSRDPFTSGGKLHFPQVTIITKGNHIKIREAVTEVDARLIAMPNSSAVGGSIHTCADNTDYEPIFSLSTSVCEEQLTITGQIFAKTLFMQRTGGDEYGLFKIDDNSTPAAQVNYASEILRFDPGEMLITALFSGSIGGHLDEEAEDATLPDVSSLQELPPIY